jgi:hypothetical protein
MPAVKVSEYSLADQIERRVESPLQKFARLRAEIAELESDLDVVTSEEVVAGCKHLEILYFLPLNKIVHNCVLIENSLWAVLRAETAKLHDKLSNLQSHKGMQNMSNTAGNLDEKFGTLIADIDKIHSANDGDSKPKRAVLSWDEEAALANIEVLERRMTGLER